MNKIIFQGGANYEEFQHNIFRECMGSLSGETVTMIELGSNDCFYSIMFNKFFSEKGRTPINICVEASKNLYDLGVSNCNNNDCIGVHHNHFTVGEIDENYVNQVSLHQPNLWGDIAEEKISISDLIKKYTLPLVNILHMDIQGSEIFVIREIITKKIDIDYVFINTHPNSCFGDTYDMCLELLAPVKDIEYLFNDRHSGGYGDGLIVYKKKKINV